MEQHPKEVACESKQRMGRKRAHRTARILNDKQWVAVHAYPCYEGNHWHVGRQDTTRDEEEVLEALPEPDPVHLSLEGLYRWAEQARNIAPHSLQLAATEATMSEDIDTDEYRQAG